MKKKINIIFIHPGIQYTYRMASALVKSDLVEKVSLYTWLTLSPKSFLSKFSLLKKRVKDIDPAVKVHNFLGFELILVIYLKILSVLKIKLGHSPRYRMQVLFGWFLLPMIYFKRKNSLLVLSETAGWPLAYYAKKWDILVVMDFPSISHEVATASGIQETALGIKIKTLERRYIDYALNCSVFAAQTYKGRSSAQEHYPVWLAAHDQYISINELKQVPGELNICCLANTEQRKGIDLLLTAFSLLDIPQKRLYLIGKINQEWVHTFCRNHQIDYQSIILTGPMAQQDLSTFLLVHHIHLHVLASRFDSYGMVVPETMMLGIPNIVSPFVGAGEQLTNGVNGFIMADLSVESLYQTLKSYLDLSEEEKLSLRENVLQQAQLMTWEHYYERVRVVFEEIINSESKKLKAES